MPTLFASPNRVVIYTDGNTSPETANPPNLSRVLFDTELDYVQIVRQETRTVNLPVRTTQTSGNQNPAVFANYTLENHGLSYTPLVFGYTSISGTHVPLRGSVPIQLPSVPGGENNQTFVRTISLGSDATRVILNEYAVRKFWGSSITCYPARTLNITYFITDVAL